MQFHRIFLIKLMIKTICGVLCGIPQNFSLSYKTIKTSAPWIDERMRTTSRQPYYLNKGGINHKQ